MATKVSLFKGDITTLQVDAIVNAANTSLMGGGGVDGAIHRAGGPAILADCRQIVARQGGCKTGQAVLTTGGNLKAAKVIHTVGPVWYGGQRNESGLLASCYNNSLRLAVENNIRSIAFPNISTGVYNFPKQAAAAIAITSVRQFIAQQPTAFHEIIFACVDQENTTIYEQLLSTNNT